MAYEQENQTPKEGGSVKATNRAHAMLEHALAFIEHCHAHGADPISEIDTVSCATDNGPVMECDLKGIRAALAAGRAGRKPHEYAPNHEPRRASAGQRADWRAGPRGSDGGDSRRVGAPEAEAPSPERFRREQKGGSVTYSDSQLRDLMDAMGAHLSGKPVEARLISGGPFILVAEPLWKLEDCYYRPKREPAVRPWNCLADVPMPVCWFRVTGNESAGVAVAVAINDLGIKLVGWQMGAVIEWSRVTYFEYSTTCRPDDWHPLTVEVTP